MRILLLALVFAPFVAPAPALAGPAVQPPAVSRRAKAPPLKVVARRLHATRLRIAALHVEIAALERTLAGAEKRSDRAQLESMLADRQRELVRLLRLERRLSLAMRKGGGR